MPVNRMHVKKHAILQRRQLIRTRRPVDEFRKPEDGFTRLELAMLMAAVLMLATVTLPILASTRNRSEQLTCLSNLRQAGHAFQLWANEHGDRNPWWTSISEGGSYQAPGDPSPTWLGLRNNAWFQWAWISNQLATPKILVCPRDQGVGAARRMASDFSTDPNTGFVSAGFRNLAVSYLIGLHSIYDSPRSLLSGDRNMRFNSVNGTCSAGIGLVEVLNKPFIGVGWTNAIHGQAGNVLYTDGSAEEISARDFQRVVPPDQDGNGGLHIVVPP